MTSEERMAAIEEQLRQSLAIDELEIIDDSHLHVGHASHGGAGHFTVRVVSNDFAHKRRVKRHQMIYAALERLMGREIHALAIEAKTQNEVSGEC